MHYLPESVINQINLLADSPYYLLMAAALAALIFFYLLGYLLKVVLRRLLKRAKNNNNWWDEVIIDSIIPAVRFGTRIFGLIVALKILGFLFAQESINALLSYSGSIYIFLLGWAVMRFINLTEAQVIAANIDRSIKQKRDITSVAAIAKLLRLVVILLAILLIMQQFGANLSGLLAAGGIGGLAIGFAAKDLLANFFGGMLLYMERPFQVGDWIRAPSQGVEGTVEDIGMRMTRIRTFDQRPLYVPNSILVGLFRGLAPKLANRVFSVRK